MIDETAKWEKITYVGIVGCTGFAAYCLSKGHHHSPDSPVFNLSFPFSFILLLSDSDFAVLVNGLMWLLHLEWIRHIPTSTSGTRSSHGVSTLFYTTSKFPSYSYSIAAVHIFYSPFSVTSLTVMYFTIISFCYVVS